MCLWLNWCPQLPLERWQEELEECRLVEERFSLFRPLAEAPFFRFCGVVARSGCEYQVTVTAEMDTYPKYAPWVFVDPHIAGANERGKVKDTALTANSP